LTPPPPPPPVKEREGTAPPPPPPPKKQPKVNAWLVEAGTNRSHQLNQGDTRIGRAKDNEVVFYDKAVSREHMLIREDRGHFTLYDRGAKTGTYVNGNRVEAPVLLAHDDEIEIGDTRLRFITSR
jgi:pSer/pThr/pTyr-binding forkhead associated (FHA) protein